MQKVFFKNKSGLRLCGIWHFPKIKTGKAIILALGLNVDKDEEGIFKPLSERLVNNGYAVFRFDFRGHGESEGNSVDMTVAGEVEDLDVAIDEVVLNNYRTVGLLGGSLGGPVSVYSTLNKPDDIKALCLWNPALNFDTAFLNPVTSHLKDKIIQIRKDFEEKGFTIMGRNKKTIGKQFFEEMKNLYPFEELKKISVPTIIVHSKADTYVPYNDSVEYVRLLPNGELITLEGIGHGFQEENEEDYKTSEAIAKTVEFFKKNL
jgi:hypothetical protein